MGCNCSGNCSCNQVDCCTIVEGTQGLQGVYGDGDLWQFDTATAGTPASGFAQASNANLTAATTIYINKTDNGGNDVTTWLAATNLPTNSNFKALITLRSKIDATKFAIYAITAYSLVGNVVNLAVTYKAGSGASPFAINDKIVISYELSGSDGAAGAAGTNSTIIKANILPNTSSTITVNTAGVPTMMNQYDASNLMVSNGDILEISASFETPDANAAVNNIQTFLDVNTIGSYSAYPFLVPLQKYTLKMTISRIDSSHAFIRFTAQDTTGTNPMFQELIEEGNISSVDFTNFMVQAQGATTVTSASAIYLYNTQLSVIYIHKV